MEKKSFEQQEILAKKADFKMEFLDPEVHSDEQLSVDKHISIPTYLLIKKQRELKKIRKDKKYRESKIANEEKTMLYKNISRIFLLLLWLGIAYLVYVASRKSKFKTT